MSNNLETIKSVENAICDLDSYEEIVNLWNRYADEKEMIFFMSDFDTVISNYIIASGKKVTPLEVARHLEDFYANDLFFSCYYSKSREEMFFSSFEYLEEYFGYSELELAERIVKAGKPTGIESIDSVLFKG